MPKSLAFAHTRLKELYGDTLNKTMETHGALVSKIAVGFTMLSPLVCLIAAYFGHGLLAEGHARRDA
jgi:hypothetical protein